MILHTDSLHRIAYATDASAYRELPYGVACPENPEDILILMDQARKRSLCLIPRAGGTSIAGQVVGSGLVVDVSRHLNSILEIDADRRWARVEPGVVRDELNLALKPLGVFFSPETSTSSRCCIGGMVGNNSCGTHSLVYGSTRHHLLGLKGYLSDGTFFDTEKLDADPTCRPEGILGAIISQMRRWQTDREARLSIERNFPDSTLRRRSCGYAIDEALEAMDRDLPGTAMCRLIAGSEGTLCFITEIKLSLDPLPPEPSMVLCAHCASLSDAFDANLVALAHQPSAVELMDGRILQLSRTVPAAMKNRFFVQGDPAALIIAEFNGPRMEASADAMEAELAASKLATTCTRVYGADVSRVWALRKAGLGVLSSVSSGAKPIGVIEDTAVSPQRLKEYAADMGRMLDSLNLDCVYYGHISTGELHLRPVIDIKTARGRALFREVAEKTAQIVRKYHGSLSGEHGDGRLRGEFIPLMYGPLCYGLMRDLKACWDPEGIFNAGKIIDTPPMDDCLRYDEGQKYNVPDNVSNRELLCSIERCNGSGDCRKSQLMGGTMCPSWKVSHDELMTTRARANVLRECLTRGDGFSSAEALQVLDSCLACKGCRSECPSNVDMTAIRSEVLDRIHKEKGIPLRSFLVSHLSAVEHMGRVVRPLYNFVASRRLSAALVCRAVGFAPERRIPTLSRGSMASRVKALQKDMPSEKASKGTVLLYADEFTDLQESELGEKFAALLIRLGYRVEVPRCVESGRAAISKGCLGTAVKRAEHNVALLADKVGEAAPLVGIEPSCILTFRDEYPRLLSAPLQKKAEKMASNCLLYDEFIMREVEAGRIGESDFRSDEVEIWLHGHCHQKALVGVEKTASALRLLPGARVNVIDSGCCGMAGAFGYEKEHYRTSLAIGELMLFPTVRKVTCGSSPALIAAPGTSCRTQIFDGTGVRAYHPIEILYRWLK